jgi:hypothetical protein
MRDQISNFGNAPLKCQCAAPPLYPSKGISQLHIAPTHRAAEAGTHNASLCGTLLLAAHHTLLLLLQHGLRYIIIMIIILSCLLPQINNRSVDF